MVVKAWMKKMWNQLARLLGKLVFGFRQKNLVRKMYSYKYTVAFSLFWTADKPLTFVFHPNEFEYNFWYYCWDFFVLTLYLETSKRKGI